MTSSKRRDWPTPQPLYDKENARWHFTLDVCASPQNAKCPAYFTEKENGLIQPWSGICWMNPPYGRGLTGKWVEKAVHEVALGRALVVVALLPARTSNAWWHDWVMPYARIRFLRGRVTFEGAEEPAFFPSAICVFPKRGSKARALHAVDSRQLDWIQGSQVPGLVASNPATLLR